MARDRRRNLAAGGNLPGGSQSPECHGEWRPPAAHAWYIGGSRLFTSDVAQTFCSLTSSVITWTDRTDIPGPGAHWPARLFTGTSRAAQPVSTKFGLFGDYLYRRTDRQSDTAGRKGPLIIEGHDKVQVGMWHRRGCGPGRHGPGRAHRPTRQRPHRPTNVLNNTTNISPLHSK